MQGLDTLGCGLVWRHPAEWAMGILWVLGLGAVGFAELRVAGCGAAVCGAAVCGAAEQFAVPSVSGCGPLLQFAVPGASACGPFFQLWIPVENFLEKIVDAFLRINFRLVLVHKILHRQRKR